jgi:hypothetical protein
MGIILVVGIMLVLPAMAVAVSLWRPTGAEHILKSNKHNFL